VDDEVAVGEVILELTTAEGSTEASGDADGPDGAAAVPEARGPTAVGVPSAARSPVAGEPANRTAHRRSRGGRGVARDRARLSPLVKRLLGEHDLEPEELVGTGAADRLTPDDVRQAARAHRRSPLVKRLLREHGLDPSGLSGTGPGGRLTPDDVRTAALDRTSEPTTAAGGSIRHPTISAPPAGVTPSVVPSAVPPRSRVEKLSRTRSLIAARMLASLQTTAQLTAAVEADVTRIMHTRARVQDAYRARHGAALSPLAFITRALCRSLQRQPVLNASIDTDAGEVTYHGRVNLGLAVDTTSGLVVPNVPDAQVLRVIGLQRRFTDLANRARAGTLRPDEVRGGTFTVSNTGSRGSLFDTPILNAPEVGILATPTIEKRPVVITDAQGNDTIAIRHRTYLCLTYDHRLVDGADAARFLTDLATDLDTTDWDQEVAELG
jgi:pyruvate dehydrogenase E2 component (dihydrolipoamide acetyltransferase)